VTGESIAVNGACLTVRDCAPRWFTVAAVASTLDRTTIGSWTEWQRVNLERAMKPDDRLGGHIVLGHVDGVGEVRGVKQYESARLVEVALPAGLWDLMVPHGSLTVDGVSLTVNALPAQDVVELSLIPYTLEHTTLDELVRGRAVHVEADVIGKYVQRLVAPYAARAT
jgi:riboflavin synthase